LSRQNKKIIIKYISLDKIKNYNAALDKMKSTTTL